MYKYTYRQTEIKTCRQTDRETDSAKVLIQAEKQTDVQKDNYSHIQYTVKKAFLF